MPSFLGLLEVTEVTMNRQSLEVTSELTVDFLKYPGSTCCKIQLVCVLKFATSHRIWPFLLFTIAIC